MAAGPGTRWNNHLGVPKHFVPVDDGEPLLHRLVRQLRERKVDDIVISGRDDDRYRLEGTRLFLPVVNEDDPVDKYLNCRAEWNAEGRTLLLYGDTFYTDEALDTILADDSDELRLAYCYRNPLTGHRWGGAAAMWWQSAQADRLLKAMEQARAYWQSGVIRPGNHSLGKRIEVGPWHILTVYLGLRHLFNAGDAQKSHIRLPSVIKLRDWTADFDWPREYDGWKERRDALQERQAAAVPLEVPAGHRPKVGQKVRKQGATKAPKVSILVPFRDADGTRTPGKEWILARWRHFFPNAEYIIEPDDGVDPFSKSLAVNKAAAKATGDVFIILDADAWVHQEWTEKAIEHVMHKRGWTRPSRHYRLKQGYSEKLMAMPPDGPLPPLNSRDAESAGATVGFLWVIPAEAWWDMAWHDEAGIRRGMDERIRGWGGEDSAFSRAATAIVGSRLNLGGTVMCLWHARPRQGGQRIWIGQDRTNETDKHQLLLRYRNAAHRSREMRKVLQQL